MSEIEELLKIIESFRKKNHYHVEEDTWYSCPAHPEYSGNDPHDCLCGLLEHNLKVDKALQIVRGLTMLAPDKGQAAVVKDNLGSAPCG